MKEKTEHGEMVFEGAGISCYRNFTSMVAGLSVMAQTELTFTEKLTIEEVRELSEPEKSMKMKMGSAMN